MKELRIKKHFIKRSNTKNFFRISLNRRTLKSGILVIPVYTLTFSLEINLTSVHLGEILQEIFLVGKSLVIFLGEGYVKSFKELMEDTEWDRYGTGNYDKCSDCMAHCGYEASAVTDVFTNPLKAASVALKGPKTEGAMAKEIDISKSRDPDFFHDTHVSEMMKNFMLMNKVSRARLQFHLLEQQ